MTGNTLEQRARELLAEGHEHYYGNQTDYRVFANAVRRGEYDSTPEMHAVKAALRLPAGEDWQPIETPPKDAPAHSIGVLVYCPSHGVLNGWYTGFYADNGKFPWSAINTTERPTHWQPLPAAPRHETGEGV